MQKSIVIKRNRYIKNVLRSYVVQIDSLNQLNQKLAKENTEVRKQMNWVRERNQKLENQQKDMKEVIAQASALRTENFVVYPVNKKIRKRTGKMLQPESGICDHEKCNG